MSADEVKARINKLIACNNAIMEMPMAEPPRPKRMSRQNSEAKLSTERGTSLDGTSGVPSVLFSSNVYAGLDSGDAKPRIR